MDHPVMAEFMGALDDVNALAEASPGFVWRLQDDSGNATNIHVFDDDRLLINMSVWESVEHLRAYVYGGLHRDYLRRRAEWFEKIDGPHIVMWWVRVGHTPTLDEAKDRLECIQQHGPGPDAFDFRNVYPPPDAAPDAQAV